MTLPEAKLLATALRSLGVVCSPGNSSGDEGDKGYENRWTVYVMHGTVTDYPFGVPIKKQGA